MAHACLDCNAAYDAAMFRDMEPGWSFLDANRLQWFDGAEWRQIKTLDEIIDEAAAKNSYGDDRLLEYLTVAYADIDFTYNYDDEGDLVPIDLTPALTYEQVEEQIKVRRAARRAKRDAEAAAQKAVEDAQQKRIGRIALVVVAAVVAIIVLANIARTAGRGEPSARCMDGSISYSQHNQGTCSYHGGVAAWLSGGDSEGSNEQDYQDEQIGGVFDGDK